MAPDSGHPADPIALSSHEPPAAPCVTLMGARSWRLPRLPSDQVEPVALRVGESGQADRRDVGLAEPPGAEAGQPPEPRWLDPEEAQAWQALAGTLIRLPAVLDAQLRRDAGISHFEYQVRAKAADAAPGHVEEVRRLVFDPLTRAQSRQLREIGRRIMRAIDPGDRSLDSQPPSR